MTSLNTITYEGIRNSLVDYFSQQDEFKSYNFTAPGISTLIDALAYTMHYMSVYSNFALNESFLDTATQRTSVVSKAKGLGYMPYQYTSSIAKVRLEYTGIANLDNVIIQSGSTFTSNIDGSEYTFHTYENTPLNKTELGRYWAELTIREGTIVTQRWTQDENSSVRFVLSHPRVDINNMTVKVYESSSDSVGKIYERLENSSQIAYNSEVYTIIENTDGEIELLFGDDVISKKLVTGNIVECQFLASNGSNTNNSMSFSTKNISILDSNKIENYNYSLWRVTTIEQSSGGSDREEIDTIKLIAPKFFQRQYRDVVADDYKTNILSEFGGIIDAISVWGGENNVPPKYGSVCACIKPKNANVLSSYMKSEILKHVKKTSVVGLTFELVDPVVVGVNLNVDILNDIVKSKYSFTTLKDKVKEVINNYFLEISSEFEATFVYSKLLNLIYDLDDTIKDIVIKLQMFKHFRPLYNVTSRYEINFDNEIEPGSIYSDNFLQLQTSYISANIKDDSNGKLYINLDTKRENAGTVDYKTGKVVIDYNFKIQNSGDMRIFATAVKNNVHTVQNSVFSINNSNVTVNGE